MRFGLFKKTLSSSIATASPGPVKITGRVVTGDKLLTSEFSNQNCLYFKFTIQEQYHNRFPKIRYKRDERTNFRIADSTGTVDVDVSSAEFDLKNVKMKRAGGPFSPDGEMQSLLDRHGIIKTFNNSIRAEEYILLPETPVIAMGHLAVNPDCSRILAKGPGNLLITDKSESEYTRGSLLFAFLGLLIAVICSGLFFMI
jgi:hypothetical protein